MINLVGLWATLSRAYEIALLGNFSVYYYTIFVEK